MNLESRREYTLSIETTVGGGSISIFKGASELADWRGTTEISKAEDILEQVSDMLRSRNISIGQIGTVVVSENSESSTGEKIGTAIGKGLSRSLVCPLVKVSVLESLLPEIEVCSIPDGFYGEFLTAVPKGRTGISWQEFTFSLQLLEYKFKASGVSDEIEFLVKLKSCKRHNKILSAELKQFGISAESFEESEIVISNSSLAKLNFYNHKFKRRVR